MKRIYLSVMPILMACFVHAQEETVIWDGFIGIYRTFDKDTLYIPDIMKNSPAEKAGLRGGDRVIEINGVRVSGAGLNLREIDKYLHNRASDTIYLKIWRSGIDTLLSCWAWLY